MPTEFPDCRKKGGSETFFLPSSEQQCILWFLIQHSLIAGEIYPYLCCSDLCLVLRKSLSVRQRQNSRLQRRAMVTAHSCHLMGRHLSHGHDVSSGPQTPSGLSKQCRQHECVCMSVFVGPCVFWCLLLVQTDQLKLWLTLFGYCLSV